MANYLVKYNPLTSTLGGAAAARRYRIPPYVDGSCRREPDLRLRFPSITALCRGGYFAPKLRVGDQIVYITGRENSHGRPWRLVAILRVIRFFAAHAAAAAGLISSSAKSSTATWTILPGFRSTTPTEFSVIATG